MAIPQKRYSPLLYLPLIFFNLDAHGHSAADRHQDPYSLVQGMVKWKDILTGLWHGPDPVLTWARGSVCVFPQTGRTPCESLNDQASPEQ